MATKNTLVSLCVGVTIAVLVCGSEVYATSKEENEFKVRREYLKSRYEDFFLHYDFIDHYVMMKNRDTDKLKTERLKDDHSKDQARREYLKTRKLPGPYKDIEDGTNNKEDQKLKDQARREFLEHRSALERLEKNIQKIPPEIDSGLEDLEH